MSNTTDVFARLCTPPRDRAVTSAAGSIPSALMAAAAGYRQLVGARNDAKGGDDAWSPPD
jgi:hypothetical protein